MRFGIPPTNYIRHQQITHVLRVPLATSQSRLRLQSIIRSLRDDPLTGALPSVAWESVDSLAIHMGKLSLRDSRQIALACELLQGFDVTSCLGENSAVPLSVDLRGLHSSVPGEQRQFTHRLYTSLSNPATTSSLLRLQTSLRTLFRKQKLLVTNRHDPNYRTIQPHVKLMTTMHLRSNQLNTKPTLIHYNCHHMPRYDAKDLYEKYKDFLWTENIRLERICLTKLHSSDYVKRGKVVGTGHRSLSSILLPGASKEVIPWEDPEVHHVRPTKTQHWNNPVTPLIIPSNTQSIAVDSPDH